MIVSIYTAYIEYQDDNNEYSIEYNISAPTTSIAIQELNYKVSSLEEIYEVTTATLQFQYGVER